MLATSAFLGTLLVLGLVVGLAGARVGLPRISGYVLVGAVMSPSLLGSQLGVHDAQWTEPLAHVALGIIAYLVGGSLSVNQLKRVGKTIVVSALGESFGAAIIVSLTMVAYIELMGTGAPLLLAPALGAIAMTTEPAGTVAVLHQYRAKGPMTSTVLGVVAVDDAIGIIAFAIVMSLLGSHATDEILRTLYEIPLALAIGGTGGVVLSWASRVVRRRRLLLPLLFGFILLVLGLAEVLHCSPLLATMGLGFVTRWRGGSSDERLFAPVEYLEEVVLVLFFTVAGLHFDPAVFGTALDVVGLYVVARAAGKTLGAGLGAGVSRAPATVKRWLGMGLMPQGGVAIGLALTLAKDPAFEQVSTRLLNVILATTIFFEIVGPLAARFALRRAGELGDQRKGHRHARS